MPTPPDLSRLCIHTITTRPWDIYKAVENYARKGIGGISVWRDAIENSDLNEIRNLINDSGLRIASLLRGGFFAATDVTARLAAIDENRRAIDECAAMGSPLLVMVCGAAPGQSIHEDVNQIRAGLEAVLPHARSCGIRVGIEPLHPVYADTRSAIATMRMANDLCDQIADTSVGITVDVYHVWWDPDLKAEIERCGDAGRLFSLHICDWKTPLTDVLNDRGIMGEGIIDIPTIRSWVEAAGFNGLIEVEIFSNRWWATDQTEFLDKIVQAYSEHV